MTTFDPSVKTYLRATPEGRAPEGGTWAFGPVEGRPLISSIRIIPRYQHAEVHVWTRGAKAGHLVVDVEDAEDLVARLFGGERFEEQEE